MHTTTVNVRDTGKGAGRHVRRKDRAVMPRAPDPLDAWEAQAMVCCIHIAGDGAYVTRDLHHNAAGGVCHPEVRLLTASHPARHSTAWNNVHETPRHCGTTQHGGSQEVWRTTAGYRLRPP
jgi:hypothetical protein